MRTHLLTIGDEILIGQVIDTNTVWMARHLMQNGFHIASKSACGDTREAILTAIRQATETADIILMTGGLGPTKDDITKKVLCELFGGQLVFHEPTFERIENYFKKLNRPVTPVMREVQSMLPDNCEILTNKQGTAPGMWWERDGKVFISMPGVPFEMQYLMEFEVVPRLKKLFPGQPISHRTLLTAGIGESDIAKRIEVFEENLPENMGLAYLPGLGQVRLRLTAHHDDEAFLQKQLDEKTAELKSLLPDVVFGKEKESLEEVIGQILVEQNRTLGSAESCTGGYIAHLLTSVPGSSRYYPGSVVTYSYEMKMKLLGVKQATLTEKGAVSEETVREMALGALDYLGSDVAVAISGIAGPGGGTDEKPVGLVWLAIADRERVFTRKLQFGRDRLKNIQLTGTYALHFLRKFLLGEV